MYFPFDTGEIYVYYCFLHYVLGTFIFTPGRERLYLDLIHVFKLVGT